MNRGSMWIHVVAAVAALGFAWATATRVEEKMGGPSSVTLLETKPDTVASVRYRWDKGQTSTTFTGTGVSRRALVQVDRELPAKKPDPKATEASAPATEAPQREQGTVPGGKAVLAAATALEPLKTKRTLGAVDDGRLLAMGLAPPLRFLDVTTVSGKTLSLEIGEQSYGAQGRYARVVGDPTVHLLDQAVVAGLEGGLDALLEKRVLLGELEAIKGFDVVAGDQRASFVHVDKDQPSTRYFALRDEPSIKREAVGKLMTSLRNLRGTALAPADIAAGAAVATFVVDVVGLPQKIEIFERADGNGHLARVGTFTWTLSATAGKEIVDDASTAMNEEPAAAATGSAP